MLDGVMNSFDEHAAETYDVAVVGGGVAGLSGALTLGRARRSVLVIDAGEPRNAPASGVHGYLTRDGVAPAALLEAGRAEVRDYGVQVLDGRVVELSLVDDGFTVGLEDGRRVAARRLLVTTGLVDELPDVAGLRERWGRDVLHCPYCHGWEVRDRPIGVLGTSPWTVHQALLFRQWTDDLTLFVHTAPRPTDDEAEQLAARGIVVVEGEVVALEIAEDRLTGVRLRGGEVIARQVLTVMPRFAARAGMLSGLGIQAAAHPMGVGEQVEADASGRTAVPGVWVAGNVADVVAGVTGAADAGVRAAAAINADLIAQDTHDAVALHRTRGAAAIGAGMFGQAFWDARYASHSSVWSGNPNPHLVAWAAELDAGRALDVGSGEGADAIWLAEHSWEVTAVDISPVALQRAADHAAEAGADTAGRIDWQQQDVQVWGPEPASFDLVSAQFMHLAPAPRAALFGRLADGVAPGGSLLVVGHHPSDLETTVPRGPRAELLFTASEVAALLDPSVWEILVEAAPERPTEDPAGDVVTIRDALLLARRRE